MNSNLITKTSKSLGRPLTKQKKEYRKENNLLRPIVCPYCQVYTEQRKVTIQLDGSLLRECLACGIHFTRSMSRRLGF